jgi:hypothetical protein
LSNETHDVCLERQILFRDDSTDVDQTMFVTYYLELHNAVDFTIDVIFSQVMLLMLYNVQTTNLTFVSKT